MGKFGILGVVLALAGVARLFAADWTNVSVPFLTKPATASAPGYITAIGTPAPAELPEIDFSKWFAADAPDPYEVATWQAVDAFFATAGTQAGWTSACQAAGAAAGADRTTNPPLGALGCSDVPNVTLIQRFAVQVLGTRAAVALWVRGAPGGTIHSIEARQGEMRLMCGFDVIAREGGADSPYAQACTLALGTAYLAGDGKATFDALAEAYALVAAELARRDPTIDAEPGYYGATASATPSP